MKLISVKKSNTLAKLPLVRQGKSWWELICLFIGVDGNLTVF